MYINKQQRQVSTCLRTQLNAKAGVHNKITDWGKQNHANQAELVWFF